MSIARFSGLALIALFAAVGAHPLNAQTTIGYAEALGNLTISCRQDIAKLCSKADLGGGRVADCLEQNWSKVTPLCKAANADVRALLKKRAAARASVARVCELDALRLCSGVQPGDGRQLECFYKTRANVSATCRQTIADAGYDVSLATGPATNQIHLSSKDILSSLQGVESAGLTAERLRDLARRSLNDPARADPLHRRPLYEQLGGLAQMTVAIEFDLNSARIKPTSYRAIGLMADALYHPYLQGYCFLIVGHTDAVGGREHNLRLSERRAEAVRAALINPFGINQARIAAAGLGEEQLFDSAHPTSPQNRRVQLINIGTLGKHTECPDRREVEIK